MKFKIIFFIALLSPFINMAQNLDQPKIALYGDIVGDSIFLRWLPDPKVFNESLNEGYTLAYYHRADSDSIFLQPDSMLHTKVIVSNNIIMSGITYNATDSLMQSLYTIHYDFPLDSFISNSRKLGDAVKYKEVEASKYLLSMMIADQRPDLSVNLGLGYKLPLSNFEKNFIYRFSVISNDTLLENTSAFIDIKIPEYGEPEHPEIVEISGYSGNKEIFIQWNIHESDKTYNYYNFYRSDDDGINYTKVNKSPFTFTSVEDDLPQYATYKDTIPDNQTTYVYKMEGISMFGYTSPFSDTIHLKGVNPRMNLELKLDTITFGNGNIHFNWESLPSAYNDSLTGFDIFYTSDFNKLPLKFNDAMITSDKRTYQDTMPGVSAYYYLVASDINGHNYESITHLGQDVDTIPPVKPIGLIGSISKNGGFKLTWTKNPDKDIKGYLIYHSNSKNGTYAQMTNEPVKTNEFISTLDVSFELDSASFYIEAVDRRFNRSAPSDPCSLARPDIYAPMVPTIRQLIPREEGIRIAWAIGNENGVSYTLKRKRIDESNFTAILTILPEEKYIAEPLDPTEEIISNYLDDDSLDLKTYQYFIEAQDQAGNKSASKVMSVTPYDDGLRGTITNFSGVLLDISNVVHPLNNPNAINPVVPGSTAVAPLKKIVRLNWQYNTTFPASLRSFKLYRKTPATGNSDAFGGRDYALIATIPYKDAQRTAQIHSLSGYAYIDDTVLPARSGTYKYKVMAYHNDGSTSTVSAIVEISYIQ